MGTLQDAIHAIKGKTIRAMAAQAAILFPRFNANEQVPDQPALP